MSLQIQPPIVCLITAGEATPQNFDHTSFEILKVIRTAAECGVQLIQIREKLLTAKLLYELARDAVEITRNSSATLLINDRVDVAIAATADGVHLTTTSIPVTTIRAKFKRELVVGVSTHTLDEVEIAKRGGADFAVFGPVFPTPEKGEPAGLGSLADVCRRVAPFPVLGLGGIDAGNYRSVIDAGASGFAAIRMLNNTESLPELMREFIRG